LAAVEFGLLSGIGYKETTERSLVVAVNKSPSGLPLFV